LQRRISAVFEGRTDGGHFAPGNQLQVSRPPTALAYRRLAAAATSAEDWRKIVERAIRDAIEGEDGATRHAGRSWLAKVLGLDALKPQAEATPRTFVAPIDAETEALARALARKLYGPPVEVVVSPPTNGATGTNGTH
jgi:hypothetical protein